MDHNWSRAFCTDDIKAKLIEQEGDYAISQLFFAANLRIADNIAGRRAPHLRSRKLTNPVHFPCLGAIGRETPSQARHPWTAAHNQRTAGHEWRIALELSAQ
jgi:hypothetical protein